MTFAVSPRRIASHIGLGDGDVAVGGGDVGDRGRIATPTALGDGAVTDALVPTVAATPAIVAESPLASPWLMVILLRPPWVPHGGGIAGRIASHIGWVMETLPPTAAASTVAVSPSHCPG